ncbi:uncharacterized protein LOC129740015 [Uranotaenia lowii]|uniref:uncharacterized protein LOC129740015 n=1 Tax=Uranotaenia lowii TaxID=190385 RepID=UPI00247B08AE|nr:uncharacterized protein LOC129740015 [Uranotaenia lowii]
MFLGAATPLSPGMKTKQCKITTTKSTFVDDESLLRKEGPSTSCKRRLPAVQQYSGCESAVVHYGENSAVMINGGNLSGCHHIGDPEVLESTATRWRPESAVGRRESRKNLEDRGRRRAGDLSGSGSKRFMLSSGMKLPSALEIVRVLVFIVVFIDLFNSGASSSILVSGDSRRSSSDSVDLLAENAAEIYARGKISSWIANLKSATGCCSSRLATRRVAGTRGWS